MLRLANHLQTHGWTTSILTLAPEFYRHSIQVDDALLARVEADLEIVRTGAYRGVTRLIRWRNALSRRRVPERSPNGEQRPKPKIESDGWRAWRRRAASSLFGFPDDEIGWFGHAMARGLRLVRRHGIDVVLSSAPPFTCHLIGYALSSACQVRWVADFRDPWARAPWGKPGSVRAHQWLETRVVNRADAVVLNTPELHREFTGWYGPETAARFHVVTNGYDADVVEPYANAAPAATPSLILTHAGNLYGARNPLPLLEALARCFETGAIPPSGIRLGLVGKIAPDFEVDAAIARLGLAGAVTRTPPVTHGASLRILAASHVLVVIQPDTSLQVPAKLYEYVGLKRPVLALAEEGAVSRIVREGGFGVVAAPADVDGIAAALADLYRRRETLVEISAANAHVARFDAKFQSALMAEILSALVPPSTAKVPARTGESVAS